MSAIKKIICIITAALTAVSLCGCSVSDDGYPNPTERFFVNDFADVMDAEDEDEFFNKAAALATATGAQTVIVTVEDLDGEEPSVYALELGRKWGVGAENEDNGIVILLSRDDREIYIAVGYGLEGALPDSKTGRIIDRYGLSYLKEDNFSKGLLEIGKVIINEIYLEYGLEPETGYVPIDSIYASDESFENVAETWIIMIIVILLLIFFFRGRRGPIIFFGNPRGFTGGFSSGRSGGSFGGFSGGGGSFGGGGAGRGF